VCVSLVAMGNSLHSYNVLASSVRSKCWSGLKEDATTNMQNKSSKLLVLCSCSQGSRGGWKGHALKVEGGIVEIADIVFAVGVVASGDRRHVIAFNALKVVHGRIGALLGQQLLAGGVTTLFLLERNKVIIVFVVAR
jgi:hypothetical protein